MSVSGFDPSAPWAVEHHDEPYASVDGLELLARIRRPREATGAPPLPALVDVHGGAWTYFDRHADGYFAEGIAACGVVVISLDFRQGEEHPFPASLCDVLAGVRWTRSHAARLGVDPDRIGLIGGSSGGHLALLAGVRPRAPELASAHFLGADGRTIGAEVCTVLALWPIANPLERYRYLLRRRDEAASEKRDPLFRPDHLIAGHEGHFRDEETMRRASLSEVLAARDWDELPPIWVAQPELDENVTTAMTERFVADYRRAGGDAELEHFAGLGHGFANFPGEDADRGIARMRAYLSRRFARA